MRRQRFDLVFRKPGTLELVYHLVLGLAQHQRLRLRKTIGDQLGVMRRQLLLRIGRHEEIARDDRGPLMDQLVKGVLPIRPRLTPDDRSGFPRHGLAV